MRSKLKNKRIVRITMRMILTGKHYLHIEMNNLTYIWLYWF